MNLLEELELQIPEEECDGHEPGPYQDQGVTVFCDGSCRNIASSRNHRARVIKQVRELLRRDWSVRVLDAWAARYRLPTPSPFPGHPEDEWRAWVVVTVTEEGSFAGPTPDAARLAAAESIWPELPESVRAELGERP